MKESTFTIKLAVNGLKTKRDNAVANKEYVGERVMRLEAELEDI